MRQPRQPAPLPNREISGPRLPAIHFIQWKGRGPKPAHAERHVRSSDRISIEWRVLHEFRSGAAGVSEFVREEPAPRGISRLSRAEALRLVARADCRERRRRRGGSGATDFERAHDPRLSGAPLGMGSPRRNGYRRGGRRDAAGLGVVGTAPALLRGPVRFGPAGRTLAGSRRASRSSTSLARFCSSASSRCC